METTWYYLLAAMLGVYVALDGMDIGVGLLHLWVARTEPERAQTLRSIGPVWDGNEVWLIAAGGTFFAIFPALYAAIFSGFYLALMAVLWLLVFRALAIELRHHMRDPLWTHFWDVAFCVSSLLLTALFGTALGNLVRGVRLDDNGDFFIPLWTDFRVGERLGILDWYTLFIAASAVLAVAFHGSLWLSYRTDGAVQQRAARLTRPLSTGMFAVALPITLLTGWVQPQLVNNLSRHPVTFGALGLIAFTSMLAAWFALRKGRFDIAFRCSSCFLVSMVISAAFGIYPLELSSRSGAHSLTLEQAAAPHSVLASSLFWFIPGVLLAGAYTWLSYHRMPAVFSVDDHGDHDDH
jgi:cytochrome bd ubiquinol oxidase subunit II